MGSHYGRLPMASDWERRGLLPKGLSLEQLELTGDRVLVHSFARSTAASLSAMRSTMTAGTQPLSAWIDRPSGTWPRGEDFACRSTFSVSHEPLPDGDFRGTVFLRGYQPPCATNLPTTGPGAPAGSHVGRTAGASVGRAAAAAGEQGYVSSERACCFALHPGTTARDRDR